MDSNPEVAELYQDTLHLQREEKEKDWSKLSRIQERFDQFKDEDLMDGIPKSKFDLQDSEPDEAYCTTDFSDPQINDMYKRYRLIFKEAEEEYISMKERDKYYVQSRKNMRKNQDPRGLGPYWLQLERLDQHVTERKQQLRTIETKLANIRMLRTLRKMSVYDLINSDDPVFAEWFDPQTELCKDFLTDPEMPQEVRKVLNARQGELQN